MAKFAIACPKCGKYAEGKTGFFARKKIECSCGNIIDVRTDKLAAKKCPHCGNQIVFDQTKGADAVCPICQGKVNTLADQQKLQVFSCKQCGIRLSTAGSASTFVCPVCDCENDVQERLISEKIRKDGLASIIKYEGDNSTFIWKHPIEDFNYGSQLIVHESQEAVFFKDGQALDLFGPGRYTLETQQLPLLEKAYNLPTDTEGTFHSEVYFINKTVQMAIKWGTPEKVRFIDPLTGVPLQLGASGEMNVQVSNSRKLLIKLVGTMKGISWEEGPGLTKSLQASFRPLITTAVKVNLPNAINKDAIDILEIDAKLDVISASLREAILPGFDEYGLTIPEFFVTNVVLPEEDPNFRRIRELHTITLQTRMYQAEATVKTAKAQSETMYRTAEEQSKAAIEAAHREAELQRQTTETEIAKREAERKVIGAQAEAQAQRMGGLTEAEIMRAKGYTQRDVLQAEVQKSYAEGIGNMGPVVSGGGGGSSIVGDMLGLGVGMAAASAIAP
ncbi:MAG: SPFH domain-containing protein, partial [Clostridiales bacterium]|nr:SPFH domain-containing protein [Clostridiales bacterium]